MTEIFQVLNHSQPRGRRKVRELIKINKWSKIILLLPDIGTNINIAYYCSYINTHQYIVVIIAFLTMADWKS